MVTSKTNGNSIFLPAAGRRDAMELGYLGSVGFYWSSSPDSDGPSEACSLQFNSGDFRVFSDARFFGLPVRPVRAPAQ